METSNQEKNGDLSSSVADDETNHNRGQRDNGNLRASERDRSIPQRSEPIKDTSEEVLGSVGSSEYKDANASAVDDNFASVRKRTPNDGLNDKEVEDGSSHNVVPTTESGQKEAEVPSDDKAINGTKKNESNDVVSRRSEEIEKLEIVHNDDINESNSSHDMTELPETVSAQAELNNVPLSVTKDNESVEPVSKPKGNTGKPTKTMAVVHQADINETNNSVSASVSESADASQKETKSQSKHEIIDSTNGNEGGEHIKSLTQKTGNIITTVAIVHRKMVMSKSGNGEESYMLTSKPVNRNKASKVEYDGRKKGNSTTEKDNGKLVSNEVHLAKRHEAEPTSDFGDKQADDRLGKHTSNISNERTIDENEQLPTFERSEEEHTEQKRDAGNDDTDNCTKQKFASDNVDEKVNQVQEESKVSPTTQHNSGIDENWMSVVIKQEPLSDLNDEEFNHIHEDSEETTELQEVSQQKVLESSMNKPATKKGNIIETKQKKTRGKTKGKASEGAGETTKMVIVEDSADENYKDAVVKKEVFDAEEGNRMVQPDNTAGHQNDVNKTIVAEVEAHYATKHMLTRGTDPPLHATTGQKGQKGSDGRTKEKKSKARKKLENVSSEIQMKTRAGKSTPIKNKLTDQPQDLEIVDRYGSNTQTTTRKYLGQATKERKQKEKGLKTRKTLPQKGLIKEEPMCETELNEGQCLGNQVKKPDITEKRKSKVTSPPSDRILVSAESDRKYHSAIKTEDPLPMHQTEPLNLEIGTIMLKRNHEKEKLSTTRKRSHEDSGSTNRDIISTVEMKTRKKGAKRNKNSNHGMKTVSKKVKQVTRMNRLRNGNLVNQSVARTTFTEKQAGPKKNTANRNIKKLMDDKPGNGGIRKSEGKLEEKSPQEHQPTPPTRITRQQDETLYTKEWNEKSTNQEHQPESTRIIRQQNENSTNQEHQSKPTRIIRQRNEKSTNQEHQSRSTRVARQKNENRTNQKQQSKPTRITGQQNEKSTNHEHQPVPTRITRQQNENNTNQEHQPVPTLNTRQQNDNSTSQEPQRGPTRITRLQNENSIIQEHQPGSTRITRQQNENSTIQKQQPGSTRITRKQNEDSIIQEHQPVPTQNTRQQNKNSTSQEQQPGSIRITRQQNENSISQEPQPRPTRTSRQKENRSSARRSKSVSDKRQCTRSQTVTGLKRTDNVVEQGKRTCRKEEERSKGTAKQVNHTSLDTGNKKQAVAKETSRSVITREINVSYAAKDEELNDYQNETDNLAGQKSEDKHVHKQDIAKVNKQSCSDTSYINVVEFGLFFCSNL